MFFFLRNQKKTLKPPRSQNKIHHTPRCNLRRTPTNKGRRRPLQPCGGPLRSWKPRKDGGKRGGCRRIFVFWLKENTLFCFFCFLINIILVCFVQCTCFFRFVFCLFNGLMFILSGFSMGLVFFYGFSLGLGHVIFKV